MSDSSPIDRVPTLPPPQPSSVPPSPSLPPKALTADPSMPVLAPGEPSPRAALVARPSYQYQAIPPSAPGQLPRGMVEVSPWGRLGAYLFESVLIYAVAIVAVLAMAVPGVNVLVSLLILAVVVSLWTIWAVVLGSGGQTPAKRLLGHTVIAADTHRPVGLGRMIWVRGVLGGFVATIAIVLTLGIVLFMPFWNKHNQNIWDRISNCYVVRRP